MPRFPRRRYLLLLAMLGLSTFALPQVTFGCEICEYHFFLGFSPCRPVTESEVGSTTCTNISDLGGFSCRESGSFCQNITIGGGGGPGGGGSAGGSNACQTSGACPAECFSCSGGGRPAV